jgi:hypothetical protein
MASTQLAPQSIAARASSNLSAKQYYSVVLSQVSGEKSVTVASTQTAIGILNNAPVSGDLAAVIVAGGAKAKIAGTVSAGNFLKSDSSATLIAVTTDKDRYCAQALQDGVSGDIIEVNVVSGYYAA